MYYHKKCELRRYDILEIPCIITHTVMYHLISNHSNPLMYFHIAGTYKIADLPNWTHYVLS